MSQLAPITEAINALADPQRAAQSQRYFKTGAGQYGAGDLFLGVRVPELRRLAAANYVLATPADLQTLLSSAYHEYRLTALFILVWQFKKAKSEAAKESIVQFYLANIAGVNNWDLVDSSAPYILGAHLFNKPKALLYQMARSGDLWKQRIAMIATQYFIKNNEFSDTFKLAEILLHHPHDLIHKATGWMLREVGEKDQQTAMQFLVQHYHLMPRTMLRYAIEKFEPRLKEQFMKGTI